MWQRLYAAASSQLIGARRRQAALWGLSNKTTMIKIVFPQAFKNVAPAIFNEFIALLKETSVGQASIGIQDLTKGGDIIRSITYDAYPWL